MENEYRFTYEKDYIRTYIDYKINLQEKEYQVTISMYDDLYDDFLFNVALRLDLNGFVINGGINRLNMMYVISLFDLEGLTEERKLMISEAFLQHINQKIVEIHNKEVEN